MRRWPYHLALVYCATIWGATFFVVKDALATVDPVAMVGYRFLLAAAALLPWVARRPLARDLRPGAVLALFLTACYLTQTVGLQYTTASSSGFITGLFVVFVPLFQRVFLRRSPTAAQWAATGLALAGLWLLTGGPGALGRGDALTLLTAMAYAAHVLATDRFVKADTDPLVLAFHQFWIVGAASFAVALATGSPLGVAPGGFRVIGFLALFPSLSAFSLQMFAQRHTSPMTASLIFSLEPVFAAVFAWTAGGEPFVPIRAAGGALVVAAMLLGELTKREVAVA